jgi:lysophospholipase L1-like esterase
VATWIAGEALKPYIHGAPYLSFDGQYAVINRLDPAQRAYPLDMWNQSISTAGVRLEFQTSAHETPIAAKNPLREKRVVHGPAQEVALRLRYMEIRGTGGPAGPFGQWAGHMPTGPRPPNQIPRPPQATVSIWQGGKRLAQFNPQGKTGEHEVKFSLPGGADAYTVYLPYNAVVHVGGISADGIQPVVGNRPRLLAFGDSITHGFHATDPGMTYPAIIARNLDLDHFNLGYAGIGRGEPVGAEVMATISGDVITLHYGTNTMPRTWYDQEGWDAAFKNFIKVLRSGHPRTPILVVTPLYRVAGDHETNPNKLGMTLPLLRKGCEAAVKSLRAAGDSNLHLLHGTDVIGAADTALLDDGLHPNDPGMERMAQRIGARVTDLVKVAAR